MFRSVKNVYMYLALNRHKIRINKLLIANVKNINTVFASCIAELENSCKILQYNVW